MLFFEIGPFETVFTEHSPDIILAIKSEQKRNLDRIADNVRSNAPGFLCQGGERYWFNI